MSSVKGNSLESFLNSLHDAYLREKISELTKPVSKDFHKDLLAILAQLGTNDLTKFAEHWRTIEQPMRSAFVVFIVTGADPDNRLLAHLDENSSCRDAVDLAFTAHIGCLQALGKSLSKAEEMVLG